MSEQLLTCEEISEILESAIRNAVLRVPNVMSFGKDRTSILTISPKNEIILIQGDKHTGFEHINNRHNFWSDKFYWINDGTKIKLDEPGKFSSKSMPIVDYEKFADDLYCKENLNIEKNKNPDLFDMFSGIVIENSKETKYHMLLYKDTKILHTMYPHNKSNNRKKIIDFVRGKPTGQMWANPLLYTIAIPYSDALGRVKWSFQVTKEIKTKLEEGVLINHKFQESRQLYQRTFEKFDYDSDLFDFKYINLDQVEKLIKKLEEMEKNGC